MKKIIIIFLLIIIGIIAFQKGYFDLILQKTNQQDANKQTQETDSKKEKVQMANPASVYCKENDGKLEIRKGNGGESGFCIFPDGSECEEWAFFRKECFSETERKFNESGRAKAYGEEEILLQKSGQLKYIEDENGNWKIYNNPQIGFSIQYPSDTIVLTESQKKDPTKQSIKIRLKDMGVKEIPLDLTPEEEIQNVQSLTSGKFGINHDFPFPLSKKVESVGFLFAQDFLTLSRFEVCDVTLERKLVFYFNNKEITITSYAPTTTLKETMPEYFTVDEKNCGKEKMWNHQKQNEFYKKLESGNGSEEIQIWFDDFDQIIETVIFTHK